MWLQLVAVTLGTWVCLPSKQQLIYNYNNDGL